jgi:hypothetical protein
VPSSQKVAAVKFSRSQVKEKEGTYKKVVRKSAQQARDKSRLEAMSFLTALMAL